MIFRPVTLAKFLAINLGFIGLLFVSAAILLDGDRDKSTIQSVELQKNSPRIIAGVPVPTYKPGDEPISFFEKLAFLKSNSDEEAEEKPKQEPVKNYKISQREAALYHDIFALQAEGDMTAADKKIESLKSDILMGHVLAQRYLHPTAHRATYSELKDWMDQYNDHPQAMRIYKLALLRQQRNPTRLKQPIMNKRAITGNLGAVSKQGRIYISTKRRTPSEDQRVIAFKQEIKQQLRRNQPTLALNILNTDYAVKDIDHVEYDRLRAQIAAVFLFNGKIQQALSLSSKSLARSRDKVPMAGWVKGLAQWRFQNYASSANAFAVAAKSSYSSGWLISAAAYWTSRANMRAGRVKKVEKWLNLASTYPRTFYGLIATRALGHNTDFNWDAPKLTCAHEKALLDSPYGTRAIALARIGQIPLAEAELRQFDYRQSSIHQEALMAFVIRQRLPALSMQLGNAYKDKSGRLYDAALYPEPGWQPASGYIIDRALIHAIIRQESKFRVNAQNPSGATGLMQVMPMTANYISGETRYTNSKGRSQLLNPYVNIEIGQKYVDHLLNHRAVGQDLLSLAIAYNAGPGNLAKWKAQNSHGKDPLYFIETIPFYETRAFVERVLANYWIYRMRYNQKTPTLDAVAQGDWARYAAQDKEVKKMASAK